MHAIPRLMVPARDRHAWLVQVQPHPETEYTAQGRAVLATGHAGQIEGHPRHGFFVHETRLLSRCKYLVNGHPPLPIACSNVEQHSWLGYFAFTPPGAPLFRDTGSGAMESVSEETVELRISRTVGLGLHEDLDFTNFSQSNASFTFAVELAADFADQTETQQGSREQKGSLKTSWKRSGKRAALLFDYRNQHRYSHQGDKGKASLHRALLVEVENAGSRPDYKSGAVRFSIRLKPGERWHACLKYTPQIEGERMPPLYRCHDFFGEHSELDRKRRAFVEGSTSVGWPRVSPLAPVVMRALQQAKHDLAGLRLYDLDRAPRGWVMAAGLPIYIALFGRDVLTSSWQASMLSPEMMCGVLPELVKWQGSRIDDWRDEQPGRMLHEAHTGPLATLGYNPRSRYYGAQTTSSFFPFAVSALWQWTADRSLVEPLVAPALRAIRWKDKYANLRGDGFSYYKTCSTQGNQNQGWKDSGDAIVYADGSQVAPPIATCEEQAYVYVSKIQMALMLWFLRERALALQLFSEARELRQRFHDSFWMEKEKFLALGLDARGRQITSITSNPGHCLACGIVAREHALPIARRLLSPELFSGWGVRTLSADHPAYDPFSYHRGSVWPVEHGTIALAFLRYGLHEELHTMARALFEATAIFPYNRLPECFSGHARDREHPFPALYPKANWPQAWSASALFSILEAMLGIYPFAPLKMLLLDPVLPDWLPEISLHNLRIGKASVSLRFFRKGTRTDWEIMEKRGSVRVLRQPSPWSLTAGWGERLEDLVGSLAH